MGSNQTASTLILAGGIINLLGSIGFLAIVGIAIVPVMMFAPEAVIWVLLGTGIIFIPLAIIGIIFGVIPLMWRHEPERHKVGLIILGVLSLGTIGGLLLLIAGIIAEEIA